MKGEGENEREMKGEGERYRHIDRESIERQIDIQKKRGRERQTYKQREYRKMDRYTEKEREAVAANQLGILFSFTIKQRRLCPTATQR